MFVVDHCLESMLGWKSRDIRTANTVITIFGFTCNFRLSEKAIKIELG